jgi:hypothetical protein
MYPTYHQIIQMFSHFLLTPHDIPMFFVAQNPRRCHDDLRAIRLEGNTSTRRKLGGIGPSKRSGNNQGMKHETWGLNHEKWGFNHETCGNSP